MCFKTRVRVRTNPYIIDELAVASFDGRRLTLASATTYPVSAGWGYLLLGQLWMLDSAGEWYHDASARQLYAWMPKISYKNPKPVKFQTLQADFTERGLGDFAAFLKEGKGKELRENGLVLV